MKAVCDPRIVNPLDSQDTLLSPYISNSQPTDSMVANISFSPPPNYSIEIPELPETDDEANVQKSVPYSVDLIKSQDIARKSKYEKKCIKEKKRYGTAVLSIHPAQYIPSRNVTSRLDGVMRQEMEVKHISIWLVKMCTRLVLCFGVLPTYLYSFNSY